MGFLFRILKSQFVKHLLAQGLEVVEKEALERLQANQKRKRAPNKPKEETNTEVTDNG
jgi:hypothetical protein